MNAATIEDFSFTFTANVYAVKEKVTNRLVKSILLAASEKKQGNRIGVAEREEREINGVKFLFSCMYFRYEASPPFLPDLDIKNTLHGFIMLIEIDSYLFIFKDSISNVSKLIDKNFEKLGFIELCSIYNESSEAYESITTSSLNLSSTALRSRKLEASDLARSMPMLSSSRQIPRNVKKRTENDALSVTPASSRISSTRKRSSFDGVAKWAIRVANELNSNQELDSFMSNFAKPVSYPAMVDQLVPTGVFLRLSELEDEMGEWVLFWESKKKKGREARRFELKEKYLNRLFKSTKDTFIIEKIEESYVVKHDGIALFNLNLNPKSLSVTGKISKHIICKNNDYEENLAKYIKRNRLLQVSFSDHTLQYCSGTLFQDERIINDIDGFLRSFKGCEERKDTSSEKGLNAITDESTRFPDGSVFDFVESKLAENDDYIVCDDLGTEWADHIGINIGHGGNPSISFYVSKHKSVVGTSASQFHDVVGQALKNISIINISVEEFESRANGKWKKYYKTDGIVTKIKRLRKGDEQIVEGLKQVLAYPNTIRNMVLVVDFISKESLQVVLKRINERKKVEAHFTQLFWILASFMSTCREMNVAPIVVCQP